MLIIYDNYYDIIMIYWTFVMVKVSVKIKYQISYLLLNKTWI